MGYSVSTKNDHVYVKFHGVLDGLDIVRLTKDPDFINDFRRLQKVVHDASTVDSVSITSDQLREITVLSSIESNFTESLVGIVIPNSEEGFERVQLIKDGIRNKQWTILAARNYEEALEMLQQTNID